MTITQDIIRYKTKVSHKHMVVIYHRNTPLPNVRKGLDGYIIMSVNIVNMPTLATGRNLVQGRTQSPTSLSTCSGSASSWVVPEALCLGFVWLGREKISPSL
jgi:hypothetical protein